MMRSDLDQLDSPDSILLMYLADELPSVDRAQVEQRLARDAEWRARLEQLRAIQESIDREMRLLDSAHALPGSDAAAVRQVMRSVRQWQAERAALSARPKAPRAAMRFPWWSYPLAAAAMVTFAFLLWWANASKTNTRFVQNADPSTLTTRDAGPVLVTIGGASPDFVQFVSLDERTEQLLELERDFQAVSTLRDWLQ